MSGPYGLVRHPLYFGSSIMGVGLALASDSFVAAGIIINALPFINNRQIGTYDGHMSYASARWGLESAAEVYRRNVIGGPGSFLIEVHDFRAFGEALKRKLLRELISSPGWDGVSGTFAAASTE